MKHIRLLFLLTVMIFAVSCLSACSKDNGDSKADQGNVQEEIKPTKTEENKSDADTTADKQDVQQPAEEKTDTPADDSSTPSNKAFTVVTDVADGWSEKDGVYTFSKGGEYTLSGTLEEGRLYVDAKDQEVILVLDGATISSTTDSVIFVEEAEEVTIKAHNETVNTLNDKRPKRISDTEEKGAACIYSKDDLKIQGKGTLIVNASYNNGIHSKNDIKIKNLTLSVIAPNNAIKGNDSITIEAADVTVTSTQGDGLKTKNTDVSSKGKQRGIISIISGTVRITAADDCINAAYDVQIADEAVVTESRY